MTIMADVFPELHTPKDVVKKMFKKSRFRGPSRGNMIRGTNHCWNLNHTTFTIFIDHCESNWVEENLS